MAEYTPQYKRKGELHTGDDEQTIMHEIPGFERTGPKVDAMKRDEEEMGELSKQAMSQVPQTRGETQPPQASRVPKKAKKKEVPKDFVAEGASAKTVPDYVADLNNFSEMLYTKLQMAYRNLDKHEKVHLNDETVALHEFIVRETEKYYQEVMGYLKTHEDEVPGKLAKDLKRKAKVFKKKSEKRSSVKYAADTQTRNWGDRSVSPKAFSDFKQIYVDFFSRLIKSHLKETLEEQKAEIARAHKQKGTKLTEFFNDNPALSKRRPQKESKT